MLVESNPGSRINTQKPRIWLDEHHGRVESCWYFDDKLPLVMPVESFPLVVSVESWKLVEPDTWFELDIDSNIKIDSNLRVELILRIDSTPWINSTRRIDSTDLLI